MCILYIQETLNLIFEIPKWQFREAMGIANSLILDQQAMCLAAIPWAFSQDTQSSWGFSRLVTWYVCNNWACVVPVLMMFKLHLLYGLATSGSECATPLTTSGSRLWFALYVPRPAVTHIKHGRARCAQQCKHSCTASHLHMNSCLAAHNQRTHTGCKGLSLTFCDRGCSGR